MIMDKPEHGIIHGTMTLEDFEKLDKWIQENAAFHYPDGKVPVTGKQLTGPFVDAMNASAGEAW